MYQFCIYEVLSIKIFPYQLSAKRCSIRFNWKIVEDRRKKRVSRIARGNETPPLALGECQEHDRAITFNRIGRALARMKREIGSGVHARVENLW